MKRVLLVFAGRTKSGKTTLAEHFCREHDVQKATFSDVVRRVANQRHPGAKQTLRVLQDLGAQIVRENPAAFCRDVCRGIDFSRQRYAVLDGLRHQSLIQHLRALYPNLIVVVFYVEAPDATRLQRFSPTITDEQLRDIDAHPVEAEEDALREVADLVINTDRGEAETYDEVSGWLTKHNFLPKVRRDSDRLKRAGLLIRAWIVLSVVWMIFVVSFSRSDAVKSWSTLRASRQSAVEYLVDADYLPFECSGLKGVEASDYFRFQTRCWMSIAVHRRLYPEDNRESDSELVSKAYQAAAIPLPYESASNGALRLVRALLLLPLLILLIVFTTYWIFKGAPLLRRRELLEAIRLSSHY